MPSKESTEITGTDAEPEGTPKTETAEKAAADPGPTGEGSFDAQTKGAQALDTATVNRNAEKGAGGGRAAVAIAAVVLLACGGLVGYGVLHTEDEPRTPAAPTAEVTYEVTGEGPVDISYLARSEEGTATVVRGAELPWKKSVRVPLGKAPTVAIVLGEKGGRAACTLAIRGEHVQRATAMGEFGRATCTGTLPAQDGPPGG